MTDFPLQGIRVVSLGQAVSAPFCTRQLADMGADVIKVERPNGGDFARDYDGALNGLSAYFAWLNRGKRSIVLDLKDDFDRTVCLKLIKRADVFVHNFSPGAIERLGFGYDPLSELNPRLIWCGISGYGADGPYRDKKAYDLLIQAEAGIISLTGTPDAPAKVGVSIADIAAGLYAYSSILAALFKRERTGAGEQIDISMLECLTEWMMPPIHVWQGTGQIPQRAGMRHNMIMPYGVFPCQGGAVNFAIQNDREWARFCDRVLQRPELAQDMRFVTNDVRVKHRVELERIIEDIFSTLAKADILKRLDEADIARSVVNDVVDVVNHPQLAARKRWTEVQSAYGPLQTLLPPHNLASIVPNMGDVPEPGQHTQQILDELED
ncbi:MAG: CoA transferase [Chloroflexi bacterium]|nr:CoA transferase [Chloroflexota bacterium]